MEFPKLFVNDAGRLRSGWRLGVFVLVYIAILFLVGMALRVAYALISQMAPGLSLGSYLESILFRLTLLISALLAGFLCNRWLEGLPWRALGLTLHSGWLRDLLVGSFTGVASLALATGIATIGGGLRFTASDRGVM